MGDIGDQAGGTDRAARQVVLVVEDEVLVRMLACEILSDAGYDALEAVDAQEALILLEARPDIALLFTDVDLPGEINGLGLARLVGMRWPSLPIIATSGAGGVQPIDLPPPGRFLQKPYRPSGLAELVATTLKEASKGVHRPVVALPTVRPTDTAITGRAWLRHPTSACGQRP